MILSRFCFFLIFSFSILTCQQLRAQEGYDLNIKKPAPYQNRELRAERSGKKKFTIPRRILQNTYTHYNYVFNATNKINETLDRARQSHVDDYGSLLTFYSYELEQTAQSKDELDSVIYKAKTGIVMHDLRNDWIDDLYLLWGKAYFFQQQFDSANQIFQFINYSFADKEKDGYYKYIGSRLDGNSATSIATKEDMSFPKGLIADPPSRNNAFIWQIKTFIEAGAFTEAGNLITALKNDPAFPERLHNSLSEVQSLWFYRQKRWDSAAHYLNLALDNAPTKQERARWEYLAGQLHEKSGNTEKAKEFYSLAIDHTINPVMDIYARLNLIKLNKGADENIIDANIAELLKMAKREKYEAYRDVIYFMAAQMELERNNFEAAQAYLLKGASYYSSNPVSRNRSYLQLADLSYTQRKYKLAASFYDSLMMDNLEPLDQQRISNRKTYLGKLVVNLNTIQLQDSLQQVAQMPEDERTDYLKKLSRQLRKQQGLKEEDLLSPTSLTTTPATSPSATFQQEAKGEWYFYNKTLRAQGAVLFKQTWGNRPNTDNWRRASNALAELRQEVPEYTRDNSTEGLGIAANTVSYEYLLNSLPITPEQLQLSNDSILNALLSAGAVYVNNIEDYQSAIETYEEIRRRFPDYTDMADVLGNLYYSYSKMGNTAKAAEIKNLLTQKYADSRQAAIVTKGIDPAANNTAAAATKTYEGIYDMFIEGRFAEAQAAKQKADSMYQTNYWMPQLLYIESIYHIKQKEDSIASTILSTLIRQDPSAPMAEKAGILLDVLSRRAEIEKELRELELPVTEAVAQAPPPPPAPKPVEEEPKQYKSSVRDSSIVATLQNNTKIIATPTDVVTNKKLPAIKNTLPAFIDTTTTVTPVPADTVQTKPVENIVTTAPELRKDSMVTKGLKKDTVVAKKPDIAVAVPTDLKKAPVEKRDTTAKAPPAQMPKTLNGYTFDANAPHYAVIILNKVDPIFGTEARNAFARYAREKYYNQPLNVELTTLDLDNRLLLIGSFSNFAQSASFIEAAKEIAGTQIVPWLKSDKYSFTIISKNNLELLKQTTDLSRYNEFLRLNTQAKF